MRNISQFVAIFLFALVTGTVFGIWRGYDPTGYTATTFIEVHQHAVRGLNFLIPALGLASITVTMWLIWNARVSNARWLYIGALVCMIGAGVTTHMFNQPINAVVMTWQGTTLPPNWNEIRETWWHWHQFRTALSLLGFILLLAGVLIDRR